MATVTYQIVEHDGGWAYKVGDVFSETFHSHDEAARAANRAANEQQVGGVSEGIEFQDSTGAWHEELSQGGDRPQTEVVDKV